MLFAQMTSSAQTSSVSNHVSMHKIRLSRLCLEIFLLKKMKHQEPWKKLFYSVNHILLVGCCPQEILKKLFWRWIFLGSDCREVVSGTVVE